MRKYNTSARPPAEHNKSGRLSSKRRLVRLVGYGLCSLFALALAMVGFHLVKAWPVNPSMDNMTASVSVIKPVVSLWQRPAVSAAELVEHSGVHVTQVATTGGGGLVDLRFQVVDPTKAHLLHNQATPPAIVDQTTGVVAKDLFMGHAHKAGFHAGQTYYLIFKNPGNLVQRGSEVSVLLGNAQLDHVIVQ